MDLAPGYMHDMQSYCTLLIIISSDTSSMLAEQPRPAGAAPSPLSYRPHKMERYYAEHILQTHFGHSSDGGCGGGEGEQPGLHVHGRDAVPFLTTSGMDRNVLRCIWSVVDPGGIGTLLDMSQVHATGSPTTTGASVVLKWKQQLSSVHRSAGTVSPFADFT